MGAWRNRQRSGLLIRRFPVRGRALPPEGVLAQMAEQRAFNPTVPGSTPGGPTKKATVAEQADAPVSKTGGLTLVMVRVHPVAPVQNTHARVAQRTAHPATNRKVAGSNPATGSKSNDACSSQWRNWQTHRF